VAILEIVIHESLVEGTRYLEHLVKDAPTRGTSRLLTISSGDELVSRGFALALLVLLLLPVVPLGTLVGALGFFVLALPFILVTTKDGTNCLLAGSVVGDDVH
jgi:hypothetical protein